MLENKNVLKEQGDMSKRQRRDFRGGPVVKNLPSNAGDLSLGEGTKIPHVTSNQAYEPQ